MSEAAALLDDLHVRRVRLTVHGDQLVVRGPTETLDAVTYQKITYYKTELMGLLRAAPAVSPPIPPEPDVVAARFPNGVRIELRRDGPSRWRMYVGINSRCPIRRPNFASPHLEHAKQTAIEWYGEPIDHWEATS